MAKLSIVQGATSQSVNIFIQNSSVTTGAGLTGLVFNTSGLIAYYAFTGANGGSNAITLATLSTATSAYSSGGFIAVDGTNMPGLYRLDIPNAALAASKGQSVCIMLSGAANMVPCLLEIELTAVNNQSNAFGLSLAKTTNITGFNDIAASAIVSSGAITTSSGAVSTVTTVTNQLTAAQIATGVWTDTTAGDFTAALSIGKSVMNGVALGTGLTINGYTGNTPQTGDSYARIGAAGAGLTALGDTRIANLDTNVGSRMATYTQPTGFLAATFPTGTIANTTNITAGTITTATNLTNAPTAGDFTSTMKTSIGTAVAASAVASVTGNVGGNVTGSVGSVTNAVAITSNRKKAATATFEFLMQDSTTGAPKTGLTVTSKISKDGGAAASTSNSVTEIGLGQYQIVLTGTEMTANNIFLQFTATSAITSNLSIQTQP